MYCRKCYTPLDPAADPPVCPRCGKPFDPAVRKTYLIRPFPGPAKVFGHIVLTTIIATVVAFLVAFQQLARSSGH